MKLVYFGQKTCEAVVAPPAIINIRYGTLNSRNHAACRSLFERGFVLFICPNSVQLMSIFRLKILTCHIA